MAFWMYFFCEKKPLRSVLSKSDGFASRSFWTLFKISAQRQCHREHRSLGSSATREDCPGFCNTWHTSWPSPWDFRTLWFLEVTMWLTCCFLFIGSNGISDTLAFLTGNISHMLEAVSTHMESIYNHHHEVNPTEMLNVFMQKSRKVARATWVLLALARMKQPRNQCRALV